MQSFSSNTPLAVSPGAFTDTGDLPEHIAERRLKAMVSEPGGAIFFASAVIVTAITWITTLLVTVSSVAAYLTQMAAANTMEEPLAPIVSAISFSREALAAPAPLHAESAVNGPATAESRVAPITATNPVLIIPSIPAARVEQSTPPVLPPQSPQLIDSRIESVTVTPARLAQDQGTSAQQLALAENAVSHPQPIQGRCGEGLLGDICKERARWSYCHPDKWDTAAECAVPKFDLSYSHH